MGDFPRFYITIQQLLSIIFRETAENKTHQWMERDGGKLPSCCVTSSLQLKKNRWSPCSYIYYCAALAMIGGCSFIISPT